MSEFYGLKKEYPKRYASAEAAAQSNLNNIQAGVTPINYGQPTTPFLAPTPTITPGYSGAYKGFGSGGNYKPNSGLWYDPTAPIETTDLNAWNKSLVKTSAESMTAPTNVTAAAPYEVLPGPEDMGLSGHQWDPTAVAGSGTGSGAIDTGAGGLWDTKGVGGMVLGFGQLGIGGAQLALGWKNQKFLEDYYGKEQEMSQKNFMNNAVATNAELNDRQEQRLRNQGIDPTKGAGASQLASYMDKWKVNGNIG